jgi:tRNA(Ile)-lysidine synthase
LAGLDAVHVEAVDSLLERRSGHLTLPHGVAARLRAGALIMRRGGFPRPPAIPETPLAVPGVTTVGGWRIDAAMVPASPVRIRDPLEAWMDAGAIEGALVVRSRRPGDRLRPLGLGGGKKVQDILVDARVPVEQREAVPLVCDGRGVVWVVGHRLDERVALRAGSSDAVRLRAGRAS